MKRPLSPAILLALLTFVLVHLLGPAASPLLAADPAATSIRSPRAWTVMVYLDGDNNLEGAGIEDMNEMEVIGSTDDVAVLVQFDRIPYYDYSNGDWTTTRRYYVTQDTDPSTITSTLVEDLGELNMGHPYTLREFVLWGTQTYPADHYLLIIWDHGEGWRKTSSPIPVKGIAYDDTDRYDYLSLLEMGQALADIHTSLGRKLDILACDACLMQMAEVAYQIRDHVQYHVASEETVPWDGFPYDYLLARLVANPTMSPADLSQTLVDTYVTSYSGGSQGSLDVTLSAIDLSKMEAVATALDPLALALTDALPSSCQEILTWWSGAQPYGYDYRDLYHFAQLLYDNLTDDTIRNPAADLMTALDAAIIAERHVGTSQPNAFGLSIYYPPPDYYEPPYGLLDLGADTSWDEFLAAPKPSASILPDAYEPDDIFEQASYIAVGETQHDHWFHQQRDDDWVRFNAGTGERYCIGTRNLGLQSDTFMYLFDRDGYFITWDDDSGPEPLSSYIEWTSPGTGNCYILVQHYNWYYALGLLTDYDLFVKQQRFTDVPGWHWAFHYIDACCNAGIVSGYGDVYGASWPVTRDQMAVFISRALTGGDDNVPDGPDTATFNDVPTDHWAYKYIEYCVANGIAQGYDPVTYGPAISVGRDAMAVFIARALAGGDGAVPDGPSTPSFTDVPTDHWAYKYIEYIASEGVASGYDGGAYHPEYTCSRDQMAVFICRAFDLPM